jgi:polysaccharide biosynthesis protein PslG
MHRAHRRLAALLAVAALAAPVASAHAAPGLLGGVNIPGIGRTANLSEADRSIQDAAKLHAHVVRVDFSWAALQPKGPAFDPLTLAYADRVVEDASRAGIKLVATVEGTPCWASSAPAALLKHCARDRSGGASAWPPRNPATYAAVLSALVQRYGTKLAAIEVWNEPDQANEDYFAGPNKAQNYAQLLRAAYQAVKAANPGVLVLGGSLVGSNGAFLKALYAAGIKGYYDGLSVHYYHLTLASLRSIREVQLAGGDSKPLWLDEFGWTSCWPHRKIEQEQACVTRRTQALNLRDTIREMARAPYVAAAMVYKLQDSRAEDFGALSAGGAHKPSFAALSEAFDHPSGSFSAITLSLRRRGSGVIASGSGPVGDFMVLEAFQGPRLRFRALFVQDRFNRFSIPLPAVLGTHGLRVRVYQYWTGLARAASRRI